MSDYPFRFYGAAPSSWDTDDVDIPTYLITFAAEPSEDDRSRIEALLSERLAQADLSEEAGTWDWNGRMAAIELDVDELQDEFADWDPYMELMSSYVRALHENSPIDEVVYSNANPDECADDEWTQWSLAQRSESETCFPGYENHFA